MINYVRNIFCTILLLPLICSADENSSTRYPISLSIDDVCTLMAGDSKTFVDMYKEGKTSEDIVYMLDDRFNSDPAMRYAIPGLMKILHVVTTAKNQHPDIFGNKSISAAMVTTTYNQCMADKAEGWVQEIDGLAEKPLPKIKI